MCFTHPDLTDLFNISNNNLTGWTVQCALHIHWQTCLTSPTTTWLVGPFNVLLFNISNNNQTGWPSMCFTHPLTDLFNISNNNLTGWTVQCALQHDWLDSSWQTCLTSPTTTWLVGPVQCALHIPWQTCLTSSNNNLTGWTVQCALHIHWQTCLTSPTTTWLVGQFNVLYTSTDRPV